MKKKKLGSLLLAAVIGFTGMFGFAPAKAEAATVNTGQFVVVLDPGHGGYDSGAVEVHNGKQYVESEINWKISNYTKQELSKYSNIKVVLTRTKTECPSLEARVMTAKNAKADLLVSQHINSEDSGLARGASVLISQGTYRASLAAKEKLFGSYVMSELGKLGIAMRYQESGGMEYRLSENGSRYPNGGVRDYYAIVAGSIESNLPGVIIEHAFISNYSDAVNYLSTDAKLKKIAQADARAIVKYIKQLPAREEPVAPFPKNGWKKENGTYYYYKNGVKVVNKILTINGEIYYLDKKGKRQYGWKTFQGKTYYFQEDGTAWLGWMRKDGNWYYFNSKKGYLYKNIKLVSDTGKMYIFDKDGKRQEGWTTFEKKRYYIGAEGYAVTGFQKIGRNYYYFDLKEAYLVKHKKIKTSDGALYYIDPSGIRFNKGFKELKAGTYYFDASGKAHTGWLKYNGKYYYFNKKTRVMLKNTTLKSGGKVYKFNAKGVCTNRK